MLDVKGRKPSEFSNIGDPFVNFIYSLALSTTFKKPMGKKASNFILAEAVTRSGIRERLGSRMRRGEFGDYAEGLIFLAWAEKKISIKDAVDILASSLTPQNNRIQLREESITAFENLLRHVVKVCQI
jgi:hypothetical protein